MARRKVVYVADGKDAATVKEFADFLEAHGGRREAVTDASIDMGAAFEAGIKESFPNAEITFDKFHVIKLANEAVDQVRREEARNNFQGVVTLPCREREGSSASVIVRPLRPRSATWPVRQREARGRWGRRRGGVGR